MATAGSDYTSTSGTLTFAPGTTTQTITVPITNDTLFEGNEDLQREPGDPGQPPRSPDALGVGTIIDNDLAPTIASVTSPTVVEGNDLIYTVNSRTVPSTPTSFALHPGRRHRERDGLRQPELQQRRHAGGRQPHHSGRRHQLHGDPADGQRHAERSQRGLSRW